MNYTQEVAEPVKKHILIVDDFSGMRGLLNRTLSPFYEISEADNGENGFNKAKEVYPDLIISDVMMPGMNGIDFCKLIREDVEISHIPFLLLTAMDHIDTKLEGIGSGADFYFSKPIDFRLLRLTLTNIFQQRKKLSDLYAKDHQAGLRERAHSARDRAFLDKLLMLIESRISDPLLDADFLSSEMFMSYTKLYHKIKGLTGKSVGEFIRSTRLRKSRELLARGDMLIVDVMFNVGIQTQSYFTKAFKKEFGKTPSQFINEIKKPAS